jgi:NAD(P)H dehydrogenase (quinone)
MNRHLIIRALHRDESFLSYGTERLIRSLNDKKQHVEVRSLYDLNFDPVLTSDDFEAVKAGNIPNDILTEQEHISKSDFIWVVFPIWWTSMPAVLKGYIDRVFLSGFAYEMENDNPKGLLTDKRVILLNSMGMSYEDYQKDGTFSALELTIDRGIFEFAGMKVIAHKYFSSIMSAGKDKREKYFLEIENLVDTIVDKYGDGSHLNEQHVA